MSKAASNYADIDHNDQPPPPYYASYEHACLTLISTNRIQLIRFPPEMIDVIRQAIRTSWSFGIQTQNITDNTYEIQLKGNPWHGQGVQAVMARTMMMFILSALYHQGWFLVTSTDISKREFDRDTLVFQLGVRPTETPFFIVSFNEGDKLRLIGAPTELIHAARQAIRPSVIQREEWIYSQTAYQFKLHGYPWTGNNDDAITSRLTILALLGCFRSSGWELYASIKMSIGIEGRHTDTWFLRRINQG